MLHPRGRLHWRALRAMSASPLRSSVSTLATWATLALPAAAAAQSPPPDYERVEVTRSRTCVDVLDRLDALNLELAPLAERSQRLLGLAEAIAIEESSVVELLDAADPVEVAIGAWFEADGALAQRFLAQGDSAILAERTAGRDAIRETVNGALQAVQAQADTVISGSGTLQAEAGECTGAIFVRSGVLEGCAERESALCVAARDTTTAQSPFRFVDSGEVLWNVQQLRPWTQPTPLGVTQDGQLGGARTVGFTRTGNVVVNLAFYPLLRAREELTPEQLDRVQEVNDSLGFEASHPDIVFIPTLAIQASLPTALGGETAYILHFGTPDAADIVWTGAAGTGQAVQGVVELGPAQVSRLASGDPLTLTALRENADGDNEAVFAMELTSVNQLPTTQALVAYMTGQLDADLARLIPPGAP